jgi:hypothetical protein
MSMTRCPAATLFRGCGMSAWRPIMAMGTGRPGVDGDVGALLEVAEPAVARVPALGAHRDVGSAREALGHERHAWRAPSGELRSMRI